MKKTLLIIFVTILSTLFTGCSSKVSNTDVLLSETTSLHNDEVITISVAESYGFGAFNKEYFAIFNDKESINTLENIIHKASKNFGIANMTNPEYEITVKYANGESEILYLWLGDENLHSTLMYVTDTHTIYTVNKSMNSELNSLLNAP